MNNEQNGPRADGTECQQTLFFVFVNQIALGDGKRIVKNELSHLEAESCLRMFVWFFLSLHSKRIRPDPI